MIAVITKHTKPQINSYIGLAIFQQKYFLNRNQSTLKLHTNWALISFRYVVSTFLLSCNLAIFCAIPTELMFD